MKTMKKGIALILALVMCLSVMSLSAFAEDPTGNVTIEGKEGAYTTIQAAIDAASDSATIKVNYVEGYEYPVFVVKKLTGLTIEGVADGSGNLPVVKVSAKESYNNDNNNGEQWPGGIWISQINTTLKNLHIKNYCETAKSNWANKTAVWCVADGLRVDSCVFDCVEGETGAIAIADHNGNYTITNNTFSNYDTAISTMGDGSNPGIVTVTNNTLTGVNWAYSAYWGKNATSRTSVTIKDNNATDDNFNVTVTGSAIYATDAIDAIDAITVKNNGSTKFVAENAATSAIDTDDSTEVYLTYGSIEKAQALTSGGDAFYIGDTTYVRTENGSSVIGGTFDEEPSAESIADGYVAVKDGGKWNIVKAASSLSLDQESVTLYSNTTPNTVTLIATVAPQDIELSWESSNEDVASVDQEGVVTAKGNGDAIITVTAPGGKTATCAVTVSTYVPYVAPATTTVEDEQTPLSDGTEIADEATPLSDLPNVFADVADTAWYRDAVAYVYANDIMTGVSSDKFSPNSTTTGAMLATMLYRLDKSNIGETTGANWSAAPLAWAEETGLTDGIGFDAKANITREQFVTMLYRFAKEQGVDVSKLAALDKFEDADSVSDFATEAMQWAVEAGVIEGVTPTTLKADGTATRAQIATIFMRFNELVTANV